MAISTPANRVARQTAASVVASDPTLAAFVGDWADDEGFELSIVPNPDGSATIISPSNTAWDAVVNHARCEGGTLRYDLYMYYKGPEDFRAPANLTGDHPYSGVRNEVTLTPGNIPNLLKQKLVAKDVPQGIESTLRRHGGGG